MATDGARRQKDSSKTRVQPVFDEISRSPDWLRRLLSLPQGAGTLPDGLDLDDPRGVWRDSESSLPAPPTLLRWLIENLQVDPPEDDKGASAEKRRLLRRQDPDTVRSAIEALERDRTPGNWWVLEGPTYPDALIQTPGAIVVVEGKRTERLPTRRTTWMPVRDQMLRHMDAALEARRGRRVFGMLILEEQDGHLPPGWATAASETAAPKLLRDSLPHRSEQERAEIAAGFLGVTTWQTVCRAFGLNPADLPDTTAHLPVRWSRPELPAGM
jgi:hypothetical protein